MTTQKQASGSWGKETSVHSLEQHGSTILAHNAHTAQGELDIVAQKDGVISFDEVMRRTGYPEQAISWRKQAYLVSATADDLAQHPESGGTCQFDVILITRRTVAASEMEHFVNVIGNQVFGIRNSEIV